MTPLQSSPQPSWSQKVANQIESWKQHKFTQFGPVLVSSAFLVLSLFAGVYFALNQSQELRRSADQVNRNVELVFVPSSTPLRANTLSSLFVRLDTHGEQIDGVQVVLEMRTSVTDGVTLKIKEPSGMRKAWEKVEGIPNGKRISFALITSNPSQPFSNGSPADIAEIIFTANKTGPIDLVFDDGWTKALKHNEFSNVLRPYVAISYQVETAPSPSPTAKATITTGTGTSGTGGTTASKGTTKIPTATVTLTSAVATASGGTKVCNEACESSSSCQSGLTCYLGKCRSSSNPENLTCKADQLSDAQVITKLCSVDCSTNAECGGVLSCYRGQCRLATNPSSTICSASTTDSFLDAVQASPSPSASVSPSPSPSSQPSSNIVGTILRWLLVVGAIIGLGIAGLMGYLWYKDNQTGGL